MTDSRETLSAGTFGRGPALNGHARAVVVCLSSTCPASPTQRLSRRLPSASRSIFMQFERASRSRIVHPQSSKHPAAA